MHNPTKRVQRFKRTLTSTRPFREAHESNESCCEIPDQDSSSIYHVRNRRGGPPDAVRGAMLVALVVVTIVLYIVLWELERSSFTSVSNPFTSYAVVSPSTNASETTSTSTQDLDAGIRDRLRVSLPEFNPSDDAIAFPTGKPARMTRNVWPPPITRVPGQHTTGSLSQDYNDHPRTNETTKLSSFDDALCNGSCRFLLPVRIGEQESKARLHLMQVFMLARRLGRTVVLPNVGKSRMSACSKWPFAAYYHTDEFARGSDTPRLAVDFESFAKWVDRRPSIPSGFAVSMGSIPQGGRDVDISGLQTELEDDPFIIDKQAKVDPKILSCLELKLARLRFSLPEVGLSISFHSSSSETGLDTSTRLVQLLSSTMDADFDFDMITGPGFDHTSRSRYTNDSHLALSLADVDVLILDYDLRHPIFPGSPQQAIHLYYAPVLYDLADRLADNLGPFLGVHWRMENVPAQNLAWCAASLVSTLHKLLQDDPAGKPIGHVWLATDHPRPLRTFTDPHRVASFPDHVESGSDGILTPLRKSSTFKTLSSEYDDAMWILVEAFQSGGDLEAWTLTDLAEQLHRYPYVEGRLNIEETLLTDSGVFGILDKLVTVQAKVFVSGSTDCSKTSSFSKQVVEARQSEYEAKRGKKGIRNVVEYFGKW